MEEQYRVFSDCCLTGEWDLLEGLRRLAEREAMGYLVRHRFERAVEIDQD